MQELGDQRKVVFAFITTGLVYVGGELRAAAPLPAPPPPPN